MKHGSILITVSVLNLMTISPTSAVSRMPTVHTFDPIPYEELVEKVGFNAPQGARSWSYEYIDSRILQAMC